MNFAWNVWAPCFLLAEILINFLMSRLFNLLVHGHIFRLITFYTVSHTRIWGDVKKDITSGERGKQLTGLWITMGASKHCGGRRMAAGDLEKSQQCHKYCVQYSIHLLLKDLRFGTNTGVPKLLLGSGAIKARYAHGWSFVRGTKTTEILPIWRN